MHDVQDFRKTCMLQLLIGPVTFGVFCIGASIGNYFHAKEVFVLLFVLFVSLVIGFVAALILFSLLHTCWLKSYMEREVKQEFRERFCHTLFGCVLVLCTLITFFGYFREEFGKTWDKMDIGIRHDEWASVETPKAEKSKEQTTAHEASRKTSSSSKVAHSDDPSTSSNISRLYSPPTPSISTYPSTSHRAKYSDGLSSLNAPSGVWKQGDEETAFNRHSGRAQLEKIRQHQIKKRYGNSSSSSGYKSSAVFDYISSYRPSHSSSCETNTEAAEQAQAEQKTIPVSERITDSDWECAEGCEPEDFWITEEDDETHNSSCSRYGEGEGMYSAQGSGIDCTECGGANE